MLSVGFMLEPSFAKGWKSKQLRVHRFSARAECCEERELEVWEHGCEDTLPTAAVPRSALPAGEAW